MTDDTYVPVPWSAHDLEHYACGVSAGMRLRLLRDLVAEDSDGKPTGAMHKAGGVWKVIKGKSSEPSVIWLLQPDGKEHTWDDHDLLMSFEVVAS